MSGPDETEAAPSEMEWPYTFALRKPIKAMDDDYSALTLQEPTGSQAIKYGLLTRGLSESNILELVSDLTQIPVASLSKMAAADLIKLATVLGTFFEKAGR